MLKAQQEKGKEIKENELNKQEKESLLFLKNLFQDLYNIKIKIVEAKYFAGKFKKNTSWLNDEFFINKNQLINISNTVETSVHELAHYKEGSMNHSTDFTHQVDGGFGKCYQEVVWESINKIC